MAARTVRSVAMACAMTAGAVACTLERAPEGGLARRVEAELAAFGGPAGPRDGDAARAARILETRCAVCHGCYDAPCQLRLDAPEGLARGAIATPVYDTGRLGDAAPTRLGIDARDTAGWRALGFHDVLAAPQAGGAGAGRSGAGRGSLLARFLALGRVAPPEAGAPVPENLPLADASAHLCPKPGEFEAYLAARPGGGMPYAMAPLPEEEYRTLMRWTASGARLPARAAPPSPAVAAELARWEAFLNRDTPRMRLVARYLYEHLFLGHLHVEGDDPRRFHRLVRSETPPGSPVREIATRRPFDDPGPVFHYRLRPVETAIVKKHHVTYRIGPKRRARLGELFLSGDWTTGAMPPWGVEAGSDPFVTFADIPAGARYRFLLDDALFFVRTFIRGPVCHGQVATDVIEDRFWVSFLDPGWDLSVTDPAFLAETGPELRLPVATAEGGMLARLRPVLHDGHRAWLEARDARYAASARHGAGLPLAAIWDGGGTNPDARLTVFRNHDNAAVTTGFVGTVPETAWVIDYPVFERIYYDLVAGYDVFGSVGHQLATRLYMDHLRREGEDLFLSFLPPEARGPLHAAWYRGPLSELHASWTGRREDDARPAAIAFATADPKAELLGLVAGRAPGTGAGDPIARCARGDCAGLDGPARTLSRLAGRRGPWVGVLPDTLLLGVETPEGGLRVFTLFRDKAYTNVALLFGEGARREPEKDEITLVEGQLASYPNFFMTVPEAELGRFVAALEAVATPGDWLALVARHGHRRTDPGFWAVADRMQDALRRATPLEAGILDLSRYVSPR